MKELMVRNLSKTLFHMAPRIDQLESDLHLVLRVAISWNVLALMGHVTLHDSAENHQPLG
jgi:hypothetical protein